MQDKAQPSLTFVKQNRGSLRPALQDPIQRHSSRFALHHHHRFNGKILATLRVSAHWVFGDFAARSSLNQLSRNYLRLIRRMEFHCLAWTCQVDTTQPRTPSCNHLQIRYFRRACHFLNRLGEFSPLQIQNSAYGTEGCRPLDTAVFDFLAAVRAVVADDHEFQATSLTHPGKIKSAKRSK